MSSVNAARAAPRETVKAGSLGIAVACSLVACASAHARVWEPSTGHVEIPIWPGAPPDQAPFPGPETSTVRKDALVTGTPRTWTWIAETNVAQPTMTVYAPRGTNTGAAVVVFPGGGFQVLAMDLEGTEVCHWLTSIGITCVLLKYRVPSSPYSWPCKCYPHGALGVIGFSAGGYLVAETSADFDHEFYRPVDAAAAESDRPDFAMAIYPGHIETSHGLNPNLHFTRRTPPTFIVQAEMTTMDHVRQSLGYYAALANAGVPAEMHLYARGCGTRSSRSANDQNWRRRGCTRSGCSRTDGAAKHR